MLPSIAFSIMLHGLIIYWFYDNKFESNSKRQPNKTFSIEVNSTETLKTSDIKAKQKLEEQKLENTEKKALPDASHKITKSKPPLQKLSASKPKDLKPSSNQKTKAKPEEKQKIDLLSFRESIGKLELESTIENQNSNFQDNPINENARSDFFNPLIEQSFKHQAQEQSRLKRLEEAFQKRKDNEKYEFRAAGPTQVVRVDGVCWETPVQQGMELETRIWTRIGDCRIKEKLDFTKRKLDEEYKQGKSDF